MLSVASIKAGNIYDDLNSLRGEMKMFNKSFINYQSNTNMNFSLTRPDNLHETQ